jgi:hypothetical protein
MTPDEKRAYQREWYAKNKDKRRAASKAYYHNNKDYYADRALQNKYGVSLAEKAAMYEAQGGLCLICKEADATELDHCHTSGEIRGLLCIPCNTAIGLLKDDPARMLRAAEYINDRTDRNTEGDAQAAA